MSTQRRTETRTRRRPHHLVPDRHSWVDMVATVLMSVTVLWVFGASFTGSTYLVVSAVGVVIGVVLGQLTKMLGWPGIAAAVGGIAVYFLLGGPLTLRSLGDWALLPGGRTLSRLADQAVFGWKDLLTTLPPVDGAGPLLALPWLVSMLAGILTILLAHQPTRWPWLEAVLPVAAQVVLLAGVILLGVARPESVWLPGAVFTILALVWLAVRAHRVSAQVRGGTAGWGRVLAAAAVLGVAVAAAVPASALLVDEEERVVARTYVQPPFDIGQYPSPLASFRRYVDPKGRSDRANVYDKTLFEIQGVEPGTLVRFAALDRYDGMVWGASDNALPGEANDSFQRVSSTIHNPVEGREVDVTVTVGEGWSGAWLPTVGALQSMEFELGDPLLKAETFRYNLATSTAVVPSGLRQGDRYSFTAVQVDDELDSTAVGYSQGAAVVAEGAFIQAPAQKWTEGSEDPMARVLAAAKHLKTIGRYSDGIGRTERHILAGHNVWRLSDEFVNAPQMVGNDEQYAAVMALVANEVGVPARVVMGAEVPEGGNVTGKDVSAWVELRTADGTWRTLPTRKFMSDQRPDEQTPQNDTPMSGTVIPPPNPIPPPSGAGEQTDAELKEQRATKKDTEEEATPFELPGWVMVLLRWVGIPLLVLALLIGAVVGVKALRRRRRRTAPSASARFVGAWRELVDHARDLGQGVSVGQSVTRREQSQAISHDGALSLARRADSSIFGPRAPEADAAAAYWKAVDEARAAMTQAVGRRRRLLAAVSLTSLRRR